jgi:hypothetical protein
MADTIPTMTLQEFGRTRRYIADLGEALGDEHWDGDPVPAAGFVYADGRLYIELVQEHWPDFAREQGGWCLTLGNVQYVTNDLSKLEAQLYEFATDQEYVREPGVDPVDAAVDRELAKLRKREDERQAELVQLRREYEARFAELRSLRVGYDRLLREQRGLAASLKDLLDRVDNPTWHGAVLRARQLLTRHMEEGATHG